MFRTRSWLHLRSFSLPLDPDVASVFGSSDTVNTLLRSVIAAMPERGKKRAKAG